MDISYIKNAVIMHLQAKSRKNALESTILFELSEDLAIDKELVKEALIELKDQGYVDDIYNISLTSLGKEIYRDSKNGIVSMSVKDVASYLFGEVNKFSILCADEFIAQVKQLELNVKKEKAMEVITSGFLLNEQYDKLILLYLYHSRYKFGHELTSLNRMVSDLKVFKPDLIEGIYFLEADGVLECEEEVYKFKNDYVNIMFNTDKDNTVYSE